MKSNEWRGTEEEIEHLLLTLPTLKRKRDQKHLVRSLIKRALSFGMRDALDHQMRWVSPMLVGAWRLFRKQAYERAGKIESGKVKL